MSERSRILRSVLIGACVGAALACGAGEDLEESQQAQGTSPSATALPAQPPSSSSSSSSSGGSTSSSGSTSSGGSSSSSGKLGSSGLGSSGLGSSGLGGGRDGGRCEGTDGMANLGGGLGGIGGGAGGGGGDLGGDAGAGKACLACLAAQCKEAFTACKETCDCTAVLTCATSKCAATCGGI